MTFFLVWDIGCNGRLCRVMHGWGDINDRSSQSHRGKCVTACSNARLSPTSEHKSLIADINYRPGDIFLPVSNAG